MQPYSELANWDGSLSVRVPPSASSLSSPPTPTNRFGDISVMHSPPPPPSLTLIDKGISLLSQTDRDHTQPQSPSIYDIYHKFLPQSNQQANRPIAHPFTTSSDPSFPFEPPSHALFPLNGHELVLSQQERQIMADITLDPDDPTACTWTENDASLSNKDSNSKLFQTRSQSATAVTQRPVPTPTAVASVSASVSPSPFAPPASIAVPPASSSSSSKETNKLAEVKIMYPHNLATFVGLKERTTTENVINHTSPSASRGGEEAKLRDPSLKASLQRRESTRPCEIEMLVVNSHDLDPSQVCLSCNPVLPSVRLYAYVVV
ncbi:hypothetical protein B0F90DRAFT_281163 [Multifurca ochricompacta]|uniref:Uncharacterized protein n=1 Tax=Multifurca ochricompacta TaxID=376703 RepID=A0AAD4LWE3_9AGAM|nr:hypothetical protein B0F90DRAFT_281163 [Multifurca ochricompacta]